MSRNNIRTYDSKNVSVAISVVLIMSAIFLCQQTVEGGPGKTYDLVIERITGSPPTISDYLSVDSGAKLFGQLFEGHNSAYHGSLIDYKDNFCHYLEIERRPIFRTVKDVLKLPEKCPFRPAYYKADNWNLEDLLPPILPGGNKFIVKMGFEFAKNDSPTMNIFVRIDRKKNFG